MSDDGDLGLGESAIKAEKEAKKQSEEEDDDSSKKDSDDEGSNKKDPSEEDSNETETEAKDNSESETSGDDTGDDSESEDETTGSSDSTQDTRDDTTDETVSKKMSISFTTKSYGGRFGDYNVGAVWIEKKGGTFVRTLRQWGEIRDRHLVKWHASSKGNVVDAVTGATLYEHESQTLSWDLRDKDEQVVPDGDYVIRFEFTEDNSAFSAPHGPSLRVAFSLGEGGETLRPDGGDGYSGVEIVVP